MQTKDYIGDIWAVAAPAFILGLLLGWFLWHSETKTETRQGQPQRQERPLVIHVTDSSGNVIPDAHTSFDPQVFPFENVYKFDNSTVTTNASVTVGMVDNKLSVGMVEAVRSEGQEPRQSSNLMAGFAMTTRGDMGISIGYKLFETPPFLGLPAIDWTAGIVILK